MNMQLSETWFIEGYIDFELQKYKLLAYLKEVNEYFTTTKLYPQLADIIFHYNNLTSFRENKKILQDGFPKQLGSLDVRRLELVYKQMLEDDEMMLELERITHYATNALQHAIKNGTEIYDAVKSKVCIEPVGIIPMYKDEGYVLLKHRAEAEIQAYYYAVTLFEHSNAKYRALKMEYLDSWAANIINTYMQVKREVIRANRLLPNPAVYSVDSALDVPFAETLLPIAKRMLIKHITAGEA